MMNKTLNILLMISSPVGFIISICSAVLSVNFVLLGVDSPATPFEYIVYAARVGGGISITFAQIFGFVVHRLTGDKFNGWMYRGATAISIYMSVCTFYGMIQSGNINAQDDAVAKAKMAVAESVVYKATVKELSHVEDMIERIETERAKTLAIYDKYDRASKKAIANTDYDKRVSKYEDKKTKLIEALKKYDTPIENKITPEQTKVTIGQIYILIARDIVKFCSFATGAEDRIKMFLQYFLLVGFAILIDLTGTSLILTGTKKGYLLQKISSELAIEDVEIERNRPAKIAGIKAGRNDDLGGDKNACDFTIKCPTAARDYEYKIDEIVPHEVSNNPNGCGQKNKKSARRDFEETDLFFPQKNAGNFGVESYESWGKSLREDDTNFSEIVPLEIGKNISENRRDDFELRYINPDDENVKKLFGDIGIDAAAKAFLASKMFDTSAKIQEFAFNGKNGANYKKLRRVADTFGIEIPKNGKRQSLAL